MDPITEKYFEISYKLIGKHFEKYNLSELGNLLKICRLKVTPQEYLGCSILTALITALFFGCSIYLAKLYFHLSQIWTIFSILGGLIAFSIIFGIFYFFPTFQAGSIKKKIDNVLPFTTTYLCTMAGAGMPPQAMFKVLAEFKEYGELAKEAELINRDLEVFGMDISTALNRAAERSPSMDFKELLHGFRNIVTTGGDLKSFLHEKARGFMDDYKRNLDKYVDTLAIFVEIYIVLIIVGSIFTIIFSTIVVIMGIIPDINVVKLIQKGLLIAIPFFSLGFIIMVMGLAPIVKKQESLELTILVLITFGTMLAVVFFG
jgi:flagellar protein FlaJ